MKRSIYVLLTVSLLLAGLSVVKAQEKRDPKAAAGEKSMGSRGDKLGLSAEQKEKLEVAMKAERTAMKPLQREMRDAITKLSDLLEDNASDKDLQAGMDRVAAARKAIAAEHERFEASLSFLPVKARAGMLVHMSRGMGGMGGMGPGGMKGHPGMMGGGGGMPGRGMQNRPPQGPPEGAPEKEDAGD
ncbi:MAG: periplasmic heavy metal sensor [Elusimicrobiota bacterium]|jgi:hypothetical protein